MPNTFIDNRDRWLQLSEVDYLGQFVKAWLAFNAWYRSAYSASRDRDIIDEFKWQANPVLSRLRPLLANSASEEAEQFRSDIGLLHHRLQNYELFSGKGSEKTRITLEGIYLRDNPPIERRGKKLGYSFSVARAANGQVDCQVSNRKREVVLSLTQPRYALPGLEGSAAFARLSPALQSYLRALYQGVVPRLTANLLTGSGSGIRCGSYEFRCTPDELFAGVVEAVYMMRCTLFHGELTPHREANAAYEPAFNVTRRFLASIT